METKQLAYPDFLYDISPSGKEVFNTVDGRNTFSNIKSAFKNSFYILGDIEKEKEFESILRSYEQNINLTGDYSPWGVFYYNWIKKDISIPFPFADKLQIGDIFSWQCLESSLDRITSFLSDYEFEVMFLVTAKTYVSPSLIQLQVLTNVSNYSYDGWLDALINFRKEHSIE